MKGLGMIVAILLFLGGVVSADLAWARAGGGRSSGSRGSRTSSAPRSPSVAPTAPTAPPATQPAPLPQPAGGGFWRGIGGGLLGGLLGGFLLGGLFGMPRAGLGGFGLLELVMVAAVGYLIYRLVRARTPREEERGLTSVRDLGLEEPRPYAPAQGEIFRGLDAERGLQYIRQMDPGFEEGKFRDQVTDAFFRIQAAWMNRDLSPVRSLLTPEMQEICGKDLDQLKAQGRVNRLENIAVRAVEITEGWQEEGQDYIAVRFYANLLDYTVDERTGQVLEGSRTEPTKFEEFWTFTRRVGPNPWQLSAIQQPD